MNLKIIKYTGEEIELHDIDKFEFRTNQVENWIRVHNKNGKELIHNVCVIKSIGEDE